MESHKAEHPSGKHSYAPSGVQQRASINKWNIIQQPLKSQYFASENVDQKGKTFPQFSRDHNVILVDFIFSIKDLFGTSVLPTISNNPSVVDKIFPVNLNVRDATQKDLTILIDNFRQNN